MPKLCKQSALDPHGRFVSALRTWGDVSALDEALVHELPMRLQLVPAQEEVSREGERASECSFVLEGFFFRHKMVAGGGRQILTFDLPDALPDVRCLHLAVNDYSLTALSAGTVARIPHAALRDAIAQAPGLADIFWCASMREAAILRERLASVGRRTAYQRVAHFFCEMYVRMKERGMASEDHFALPITQNDLGDTLGLSTVHINRTLQQLREDGIIVSHGKSHRFTDWERLRQAGDFDPAYLSLTAR